MSNANIVLKEAEMVYGKRTRYERREARGKWRSHGCLHLLLLGKVQQVGVRPKTQPAGVFAAPFFTRPSSMRLEFIIQGAAAEHEGQGELQLQTEGGQLLGKLQETWYRRGLNWSSKRTLGDMAGVA
jgi:hypothetical protein